MATGLSREDRRVTIRASWFAVVLVAAVSCAGGPGRPGHDTAIADAHNASGNRVTDNASGNYGTDNEPIRWLDAVSTGNGCSSVWMSSADSPCGTRAGLRV